MTNLQLVSLHGMCLILGDAHAYLLKYKKRTRVKTELGKLFRKLWNEVYIR